jgi:hypothetical protein
MSCIRLSPLICLNIEVYYCAYAEDGAILSKTSATPDDPFLGRVTARSVPPPHNVKSLKRCLARFENIHDRTSTTLFLTPYSQSPMDDSGKVTILNPTGPGSTPQEPLALVVKLSDSERNALESGESSGLASPLEPGITSPDHRYRTLICSITFLFITSGLLSEVYYLLYSDDRGMPSKVAIDPEEPWLGRIRADYITPPHIPTNIKLSISRLERTPAFASANLFEDISCDTPLTEGHISILHTNGPGLSPNKPMALVQVNDALEKRIPVSSPPIPEGMYSIKNRARNLCWITAVGTVTFGNYTAEDAWTHKHFQVIEHYPIFKRSNNNPLSKWYITPNSDGNIVITSPSAPLSWVGAHITLSKVPVPWRLIPESPASGSKFY